ncbi:MAG: OmpA family protein [Polyangiaceae bacterium]|nr:OmpA family protein [Polyangiaceae bacterium]
MTTFNRFRAVFSIAIGSVLAPAGLGCAGGHQTQVTVIAEHVPFEERHQWSTSVLPVEVLVGERGINRTVFVGLSDKVARACGPAAVKSPRFAFDSAKLSSHYHQELRALAACLTEGPLKGRDVHLVGNAVPRRDFEENVMLGELRAETVRDFLTTHGVPRERILILPRAEIGSIRHEAAAISADRQVDILLAGEAPTDDEGEWE